MQSSARQVSYGLLAGVLGAGGALIGRLGSLLPAAASQDPRAWALRAVLFAAMILVRMGELGARHTCACAPRRSLSGDAPPQVNALGTALYVRGLSAGRSSTLVTAASTCANLVSLVRVGASPDAAAATVHRCWISLAQLPLTPCSPQSVAAHTVFHEAVTTQRLAGCAVLALGVLCLQRAAGHHGDRPGSRNPRRRAASSKDE